MSTHADAILKKNIRTVVSGKGYEIENWCKTNKS